MKKFVTIFITLENVHLTKDIGQIGNSFSEFSGLHSEIICYGRGDFPSLKTEAKNQSVNILKDIGRFLFLEKAVLRYLIKDGRNIDVLHIQQLAKEDIYYALIYKLINPKGKLLLKLDVNIFELRKGMRYSKKKIVNVMHKYFEKKALRKMDVIAADTSDLIKLYGEIYPYIKNKIVHLSPNLNDKFLAENLPHRKTFKEKENIILTTGRIGSGEKNYEMLLETLPLLNLQDWKVIFVGRIQDDFDKKVEQLILDYPHLKNKVELTGHIDDRVALYEYYNRSKIFCLTSVIETFGIAYIEALYFGNYIFGTSGMTSFDYISNQEEFGRKVKLNDRQELAKHINNIIQNQNIISGKVEKEYEYMATHFFSSKNIQVLKSLIS